MACVVDEKLVNTWQDAIPSPEARSGKIQHPAMLPAQHRTALANEEAVPALPDSPWPDLAMAGGDAFIEDFVNCADRPVCLR